MISIWNLFRFDNVEDSSNLVSNKRPLQMSRIELAKRMRLSGAEAPLVI